MLGISRGAERHRISCISCIHEASQQVRTCCPQQSGAIIWYNNCFLKYSSKKFLGRSDNDNGIFVRNMKSVHAPLLSNMNVQQLLNWLCLQSTLIGPFLAQGQGHLKLMGDEVLYDATQCTTDLSHIECKRCLDVAMSDLENASNGRRGFRVYYGSCYIRFELYRFICWWIELEDRFFRKKAKKS